ncbi:hypothetical protein CMUST_11585 [Corynebacterium mustelae]|uniref:Knr4/Smi1-like domain-containing protein n=1 Tax=Corynebacterium mustelae TaxID=571915 RepID=A0A0G3H4A0_9CORY|nr:SMI1/KNR4 family protein [Corynebacterium mustelae]AKK06628.1 hypothetical protein CMUST_11585 [Corynebacterium mustelae]
MDVLDSFEAQTGATFPADYRRLLSEFEQFMTWFHDGKEVDLIARARLPEKSSRLLDFVRIPVRRHDADGEIPVERLENCFIFGSYSDGVYLYFDPEDDMSVWKVWIDEGTVGKLCDDFAELVPAPDEIDTEKTLLA